MAFPLLAAAAPALPFLQGAIQAGGLFSLAKQGFDAAQAFRQGDIMGGLGAAFGFAAQAHDDILRASRKPDASRETADVNVARAEGDPREINFANFVA